MHEFLHITGLCGENHLSFLAAIVECPNMQAITTYIKNMLK